MKRVQVAAGAAVIVVAVGSGRAWAQAQEPTCQAVEAGVVSVDAMLDDWRGFEAVRRRGAAGADGGFELRCAFDDERLYLAVRVRDDRLLRTGRGAREDGLEVSLRAGSRLGPWRMSFHPGTRGFPARRDGGAGAEVDDSLAEDGWQLELGVPLRRIPGWGSSTPMLLAEVSYADVDRAGAAPGRVQFRGALQFSTHLPALRGFLSVARTSVDRLRLDELVEMDAAPGTERVVVGGRALGVVSDSFAFVELPLRAADDLLRVELVDFDGDGRASLLTHFRQHGGGGSREVVTVWTVGASGELERAIAFEVALELGPRRLVNRWTLVPAGQRRAGRRARTRGKLDILVEVSPSDNTGWDADSFSRVTPSPDARPILTPWSTRRATIYHFDGDTALESPAR
jgi:hypothetical protein